MRSVFRGVAAALALATISGCAVVPFLSFVPTALHVAPRILFPGHQPAAARKPGVPFKDENPPAADLSGASAAKAGGSPGSANEGVAANGGESGRGQLADGSIALRMASTDSTSDLKARAVGDVLKVNVAEAVTGETAAQTDLSNKRSVDTALPNMFTAMESLAKHNPLLNLASLLNGNSESDASGKGDMSAADTISATVSVLIVEILPSGTFKIKGERQMRLNGEDDTIYLSGVVRPEDIDSDNSVSSTQVADLRISFTGSGLVRDKQGGGWGSRLMDWLWLF